MYERTLRFYSWIQDVTNFVDHNIIDVLLGYFGINFFLENTSIYVMKFIKLQINLKV